MSIVVLRSSWVSGRRTSGLPRPTPDRPIELLADAARAADADTGAPNSLLDRADVVAVVAIGSWPYPDPGAVLARQLGISPRTTAVSTVGGNSPQLLIDEFATRIQQGDCDVVLVGGAESMHTRWRARREPRVELTWESGDDPPCPLVIGDDAPGASDYEMAHLAVAPTMVYPLFETALRFANGESVDEHQRTVSELWSQFSAVAAANPHAWSRVAYSPEEIRTISTDNRAVCFPYPEADVRQHRRRSGRGGVALFVRSGAGGRRSRRQDRVPARGRRGPRPLVRHRAVVARGFARDRRHGRSGARRVRHRSRRHRALRPVLVLPVGRADRAQRARDHRRRPPTAHGHRRSRFRRRTGQQLPDPRDRDDGRRAARPARRHRPDHRGRLVPHQTRGRSVVDASADATVPSNRGAVRRRHAAAS